MSSVRRIRASCQQSCGLACVLRVTWYQKRCETKEGEGPAGRGIACGASPVVGRGAAPGPLSLSRIEGTHTLHHAGYGLAAAASSDPTQGSYDARLCSARVCCSQPGYTRDQHRFAGRRSGRAAGCSSHEGAGRAADNFILQTGCSYAASVRFQDAERRRVGRSRYQSPQPRAAGRARTAGQAFMSHMQVQSAVCRKQMVHTTSIRQSTQNRTR